MSGPENQREGAFADRAGDGVRTERRKFLRHACQIGVIGHQEGSAVRLWANCTDISMGGCYLETWSPLPVGSILDLSMQEIRIKGEVATCHPGVGMGVRFLEIGDTAALKEMVDHADDNA